VTQPNGRGGTRHLVAAVCFRILSTDIEFLLVRTRRGRWTFPKGGTEPGLTHAQSAALEAFEEAGVHGRIEEISFLKYKLHKSDLNGDEQAHDVIHALLCEVLGHGTPEELYRNPTWFSSEKAKARLAQGRSAENAAELARVVDRATGRIRRLPTRSLVVNDPLMKVRFEAAEIELRSGRAALSASAQRTGRILPISSNGPGSGRGRILQLRPARLN